MTPARATAMGFGAVLLWASLATLALRTAPVPPFLLTALTLGLGGAAGLAGAAAAGRLGRIARVPLAALAFLTAGQFLHHALYFAALRLAPAVEVTLVCATWPLLVVVLSGCLPGERLRARHLAGAALAFGGVATVLAAPAGGAGPGALPGIALMFLSAVVWATYSVGSRRLRSTPPEAVPVACLLAAALSVPAHLLTEPTVWPAGAHGWAAVALIGLGPMGAAFLLWDAGCKHGHIQILGVLSNAGPLLSALALVLAGQAQATGTLGLGAALVAAGAALAAGAGKAAAPRPSNRRRTRSET